MYLININTSLQSTEVYKFLQLAVYIGILLWMYLWAGLSIQSVPCDHSPLCVMFSELCAVSSVHCAVSSVQRAQPKPSDQLIRRASTVWSHIMLLHCTQAVWSSERENPQICVLKIKPKFLGFGKVKPFLLYNSYKKCTHHRILRVEYIFRPL